MFVDDEPLSGLMIGAVSNCRKRSGGEVERWRQTLGAFKDAGLRLIQTGNSGSGPQPLLTDDGGGDELDFEEIDRRTHAILEVHPDALLLPRVQCGMLPSKWVEENPDELVVYHDGEKRSGEEEPQPSRSSEKWLRDAGALFRQFLDHVEQSDYADHVVGYFLMHGRGLEWFNPSPFVPWFADYSEISRARFRQWLAEQYGSTGELRKAWHNDDVTLQTAEIPSVSQRLNCGSIFQRIRNPRKEENVVDWYKFFAQENVRAIAVFARLIKEASEGRRLAGAYYGYIMNHCWCSWTLLESGHLALRQYLANEDFDFVAATETYAFKAPGTGASMFPVPVQSVHRARKLYIDEADTDTHIGDRKNVQFGTDTFEDTVKVQQRHLGTVFSEAISSMWVTPHRYDDAETMALIAQLNGIGQRLMDFDRSRSSQIAYVCDEESLLNTDVDSAVGWSFGEGQNAELTRIGAPVDRLMLDDIGSGKAYKLYIFPCSCCMTSERRDRILAMLREQRSTALWMYVPGYIKDGRQDVEHIVSLTGFELRFEGSHYVALARTTGTGSRELSQKLEFGTARAFSPFVEIIGGYDELIAKSVDTGRGVLARRRMPDGWTSIYSTVGPVKGAILRALARDAGVHIYLEEDDFFNANNTVCVLHARDPGEKEIRLPAPGDLYDILNERQIGKDVSSVKVTLEEGQSGIYFFGSQHDWKMKSA